MYYFPQVLQSLCILNKVTVSNFYHKPKTPDAASHTGGLYSVQRRVAAGRQTRQRERAEYQRTQGMEEGREGETDRQTEEGRGGQIFISGVSSGHTGLGGIGG